MIAARAIHARGERCFLLDDTDWDGTGSSDTESVDSGMAETADIVELVAGVDSVDL